MKNRLLRGWTWTRAAFLLMGILVLAQAFDAGQWLGVALGVYVAGMGLFGFGCASGNCGGNNCDLKYDGDQKK